MEIKKQFESQLKEAMIAKDEFKTSLIRMLLSSIHNREIELKGKNQEMKEEEVVEVLRKEVKKRKESALAFKAGDRKEMAEKEEKEAVFIESFLPAQMKEEDLEKIVLEVLKEFGEPSAKDFGGIMKKVMEKVAGQAEGGAVSAIIKKHLG